MEETKRKSIFKNKKIMIPVISLISIVLLLSITLSVLLVPRKLSSYINTNINEVKTVYIIKDDKRYEIEEYNTIFKELSQIKVRPRYFNFVKGRTPYKLHIETTQDQYEIDGFYIKVNDTLHNYDMLNMKLLDDLINKYITYSNLN